VKNIKNIAVPLGQYTKRFHFQSLVPHLYSLSRLHYYFFHFICIEIKCCSTNSCCREKSLLLKMDCFRPVCKSFVLFPSWKSWLLNYRVKLEHVISDFVLYSLLTYLLFLHIFHFHVWIHYIVPNWKYSFRVKTFHVSLACKLAFLIYFFSKSLSD